MDDVEGSGRTVDVEPGAVEFTFAGGASARAQTRVSMPMACLDDEKLPMQCAPTEGTPLLIGVDMLDRFGLALDDHNSTVCSYLLKRFLPAVRTVGGHLALKFGLPSPS